MLRTFALTARIFAKTSFPASLGGHHLQQPACGAALWKQYTNLPHSKELPEQKADGSETAKPNSNTTPGFDAEKRRKVLELEIEVMRQEGRKVPSVSTIKPDQWEHLLGLSSRNQRRQYYLYLWNIEMVRLGQKLKKERKQEEIAKRREELMKATAANDHIVYGLFHNTMFLRIYDSKMDHFHNNRLVQAMQFGCNLVIDCSYDDYMNDKEMRNTAKQLMLCFALNRSHEEPFNIHHCNANYGKTTMKQLEKHLVQIHQPEFPFNVTDRSYTELFPKERLVYLTPHCKNDLTEFNPDDVYIIGAMVDKSSQEAVSLGKAKKLGLRMARLPLDRYFQFKSGKSLTLDQMVAIMLELKTSNNFEKAFQHVPRRKITTVDEAAAKEQEMREVAKFKFNFNNKRTGDKRNNSKQSSQPKLGKGRY
ncbi:mitochondrial ribonuclease P protein 1 homolog [Anopheles gambiae]|uniref:mitochondrial ribonuclease P protein 1 homolog n=1 Tax=Anopheles coluzzii TaxID=1518534 RepID=UPI0020FFEA15|nr:mitochondrial ribonuclease P protein 1 homolog [Anopheles coluzzii]XP_308574.5 mitochondrial ribonuclease P protein 1 homolog [Anopheles gambiae]